MRHELTDADGVIVSRLLPAPASVGRPRRDLRAVVNGIIWILRTGAPWRDLPSRYGHFKTVHRWFSKWAAEGTLQRVFRGVLRRMDDAGQLDWACWSVDSSIARAARCAAGARKLAAGEHQALGRSRGGFTTKFHISCDGHGNPLSVVVTPGQQHDSTCLEMVLDGVRVHRRRRPDTVVADSSYCSKKIRKWLRRRRIEAVIPMRSNHRSAYRRLPKFSRKKYRRRNTVERCIGWMKECRRVTTRYEKLAVNYRGMLLLAMVVILLRRL